MEINTAFRKLLQGNAKMCPGLMFRHRDRFVDFHLHDSMEKFAFKKFMVVMLC